MRHRKRPVIRTHADLRKAHDQAIWRRWWAVAAIAAAIAAGVRIFGATAFQTLVGLLILAAIAGGRVGVATLLRRHRLKSFAPPVDPRVNIHRGPLSDMASSLAHQMGVSLPIVLRFVRGDGMAVQTLARPGQDQSAMEIRLNEGLARILTPMELKAVVAHEMGHLLSPRWALRWVTEYWADYHAGIHADPAALANALLKIDQNLFSLRALVDEIMYLAETRVRPHLRGPALDTYALNAVRLPMENDADARRQAQAVIERYLAGCGPDAQIPAWGRWWCSLRMAAARWTESHRRRLARQMVVTWTHFEQRRAGAALDPYELMALDLADPHPDPTAAGSSVWDRLISGRPDLNARLRFIVNQFLTTAPAGETMGEGCHERV